VESGAEPALRSRQFDPSTSQPLPGAFHEGTAQEADRALTLAHEAFQDVPPDRKNTRAALLDAIAANIEALGDALLERANQETALGLPG
jgi:NADP-dependent aldehyde dehydrogenase